MDTARHYPDFNMAVVKNKLIRNKRAEKNKEALEAARARRLETQEQKDKHNLLYLLKPDLLKTYHQHEIEKALVLRERRHRVKTFLVLMHTTEIAKHYKRCFDFRKEQIEIQEKRWKASLTIALVCSRYLKRFDYKERMRAWVKGSCQFLYEVQSDKRQLEARQIMLTFIDRHNFQKSFLGKTKTLIDAVNCI